MPKNTQVSVEELEAEHTPDLAQPGELREGVRGGRLAGQQRLEIRYGNADQPGVTDGGAFRRGA